MTADELNPGIRETVAWLNAKGFVTTDSGDGVTHDHACDRDYPYVTIMVTDADNLMSETNRLWEALNELGVPLSPVGAGGPCIQSTFDPCNDVAVIDLMEFKDVDLRRYLKGAT